MARYIARSASRTRLSGSSPGRATATPTLALTDGLGVAEEERLLEHAEQPSGDLARAAELGARRQQHRELVAAEPRHRVVGPHGVDEPTRRELQQQVAHRVAEAVVDRLEAVEVEEEQGDRRVVRSHGEQRLADAGTHPCAVREAGQLVAEGELGQPVLEQLALADVAGVDDDAADDRVVEPVGEHRLDVAPLAAGVAYPVLDDGRRVQVGAPGPEGVHRADEPQLGVAEVERVHEVDQELSDQLALAVAEDAFDGSALPDDPAVSVHHRHDVAGALDERAEQLLALGQRLAEARRCRAQRRPAAPAPRSPAARSARPR